jgi:hypothetical protein
MIIFSEISKWSYFRKLANYILEISTISEIVQNLDEIDQRFGKKRRLNFEEVWLRNHNVINFSQFDLSTV